MKKTTSNDYEFALSVPAGALCPIIKRDLQERLFHHVNQLEHRATVSVDWERGVVLLTSPVEPHEERIQEEICRWRRTFRLELRPAVVIRPRTAARSVKSARVQMVEAANTVHALERTDLRASRDDLLALLMQLGEVARAEDVGPRFVSS